MASPGSGGFRLSISMMELPSVGMQALFAGGGGSTNSSFKSPWSFVWSVTSTVPAAFTVMLPVEFHHVSKKCSVRPGRTFDYLFGIMHSSANRALTVFSLKEPK